MHHPQPPSDESRKTPIWRAVFFGFPIALGALFMLLGFFGESFRDFLAGFLMGFAIMLPGIWFFLHERQARAGVPLKRHWPAITLTSAALFLGGAATLPPTETPVTEEPKYFGAAPSTTSVAPTTTSSSPTPTPTVTTTTSALQPVETEIKPADPVVSPTPVEEELPAEVPPLSPAAVDLTPAEAPAPVPPAQPAQPAVPARPAQPGEPGQPAQPAQPARPAQPAHPAPEAPANFIHPGAFCTGGTGVSKNGKPMVCAPSPDGRMRWQAA